MEQKINSVSSAGTKDDSITSVDVGSSSFLDIVLEMDKYANQMYVDKRLWYLTKKAY